MQPRKKYLNLKLIFATNNAHKVKEVQALLPAPWHLITLKEAGIFEDIPEPYDTFQENAAAKAQYIFQKTGIDCFAEDSGICVDALNGAPGVFSARYAGLPTDDEKNLQKLLDALQGEHHRNAHYHSSIALMLGGHLYFFEGKCPGTIAEEKEGSGGFGYDPIFIPEGYSNTFGILDDTIKSSISHRKHSVAALAKFLNEAQKLR